MVVFVDDEGVGAGREDLEGLKKLDEGVALVRGQRIEGLAFGEGFSIVGFDGFAGGSQLSVVHERAALVVEALELAREEFTVAGKEACRASRLILVERLAFGIALRIARGADVMELEIGVSGHHDDALCVGLQMRRRELVAGQVSR